MSVWYQSLGIGTGIFDLEMIKKYQEKLRVNLYLLCVVSVNLSMVIEFSVDTFFAICDVIKQNQSEVGNIDFEILLFLKLF